MTMITSRFIRLAAVLACTLLFAGACSAQEWDGKVVEEQDGLFNEATVTANTAIEKARAAIPEATILSAELEREDGALIYTFDMKLEGREGIEEVHIDAFTGEVLAREQEEEGEEQEQAEQVSDEGHSREVSEAAEEAEEREEAESPGTVASWDRKVVEEESGLLAKASVGVPAAAEAALAAVPGGEIIAAEIENEDNEFIYSLDIRVAGEEGVEEVHVDAMTGAVVSIEHER
jgi:uncharacterized membrane protein YkoI